MPRSCEESLAARALVSPRHLGRQLPPRAIPPDFGPNPIKVLRQLVGQLTGSRTALYTRIAEHALREGDSDDIARATRQVQAEIARCQAVAAQMHRLLPRIYPKPAA